MKIAIVQFKPTKGDIEKNIETHQEWIEQAARFNVHMIVFPELSLTGYEPELAAALATHKNDERFDCFQKLSDLHGITIGVGAPTREQNKLHISMILFQPQKERSTYSKQYLYHTEISIFSPATNPFVLPIESEIVAPAICYELSNPGHVAYAAQNHATMYVASVLNSVNGIDSDQQKLSAIAQKYNLTTFMANYIGESGGYQCAGRSSVWGPDGKQIIELGADEEGLIVFDTQTKEALKQTK
jgi:predicted amidohydrolase